MLDLVAVRRAIEDVERAATAAALASRPGVATATGDTLARLYSVYAQGMLQANGIQVDLDDLCAQCCRACPPGRCAREGALS